VGLGWTSPFAAAKRGRFGRIACEWILRRAGGAAPLAPGLGSGCIGADLGSPRRARPRTQPGRAVPISYRSGALGLFSRHRSGEPGRLRLCGTHDRGAPAAVQRSTDSAGAGVGQGAGLRARQPRRHSACTADVRGGHGPGFRAGRSLSAASGAAVAGRPRSSECGPRPAATLLTGHFFPAIAGTLVRLCRRSGTRRHSAYHGGRVALAPPAPSTVVRRRAGRGPVAGVSLSDQQPGARDHASCARCPRRALAHLAAHPPGVGVCADRSSRGALSRQRAGEPDPVAYRHWSGHRLRRGPNRLAGLDPQGRGMAQLVHLPLDSRPPAGDAARKPLGRDQRNRTRGRKLGGARHLGCRNVGQASSGAARHCTARNRTGPVGRATVGAVR